MPELLELAPGDLLVDRNLRADTSIDKDFASSVAQHGVLVPIVAVEVEEGYRVRHGHRRVAAALKAKLPLIPVFVVGHEDDVDVDRILHQWAENEHRVGLSVADKTRAVEQLSAFGLRASAIAKRTATPKAVVDQTLAVSRSPLAAGAIARYDFLDLEQAAAIAEFESDKDAVTLLVAAAKAGDFAHVVAAMRQRREGEQKVTVRIAELQAAGWAIVGVDVDAAAVADSWGEDAKVSRVHALAGDQYGEAMTEEQHAGCPHAAARVSRASWTKDGTEVELYCLDWRAAGHQKRYPRGNPADGGKPAEARPAPVEEDPEEQSRRDAEAQAREETAAAWKAADEVRVAFVRGMLLRAKPDKALQQPLLAALVAEMFDPDVYFELDGGVDAARLAGRMPSPGDELEDGTAAPADDWESNDERDEEASRVLRGMHPELALLAVLCERGETALVAGRRFPSSCTVRYYELLNVAGYRLAGCEGELLERFRAAAAAEADEAGDDADG